MQNSMSGFVPFGAAMPKVGIPKFSAKVGDTRIRILSTDEGYFLLAKTHYLKGVGSFHCFGGSCCSVVANAPEGEANTQERAILPIAVATPSMTGGVSVEYMYLSLPETKYTQLVSLNQNVGAVTSYDILIQCTDENYQKYTFLPLVGQPTVILTPEETPKAQQFLVNYRDSIMKTLGKTLDENSFAAARAKSLQQAAASVGANFVPNPTAQQAFSQPALPVSKTVTPQVVPPVVTPQVVPPVQPTVTPQVVPPVVNVETTTAPVVPPENPVVNAETTPVVSNEQPTPVKAETPANSETSELDWTAFMTP